MDAVKYFILFLNVYIQIVYVEIFAAIYGTKWVLYVHSSITQALLGTLRATSQNYFFLQNDIIGCSCGCAGSEQ